MVRSASVRRIHPAAFLFLALLVGGTPASAVETVILLSFDGTTPAQIADPELTTLARLQRQGATAERLIPSFPSNTFPNHVTFVTGVQPERHGIVNNVFVDPERGRHSYENDPTWLQVEPVWSLLARHGIGSAAYYWVGSQGPWSSGYGPRHWRPFDSGTSERKKVDQILAWLELEDPGERPRLVTSWFHGADSVGHRKGPDAPSVASTLRRQDAELGRLLEGLSARGLLETTTLLLVSDHGMAPVERLVNLSEALDEADVRASVLGAGGFATVRAGSPEDAGNAVEVARGLGLEAWLREDAPLPVDNPRFGDVVVVAPVGTAIVRKGLRGKVEALLARVGHGMAGSHGHRPDHPLMSGIFVAFGAGVRRGAQLGPVRAIDVAPTLLALLGVPAPDWMEGRPLLGAAVPSGPLIEENPRP